VKLKLDISPDLVAMMATEIAAGERAVTAAMRQAGTGLKGAWRGQIIGAGLGARLANSIRSEVFPKAGASLNAAAVIWSKAPVIVGAHDAGPLIRSKTGFWLAIPTPAAGKALGGRRITPGAWERKTDTRGTKKEIKARPAKTGRSCGCPAVGRPSMRFVPPKFSEQLEIQAVHRIRQRLVSDRTRLVNQIRGLLAEHGVAMGRDISRLRRGLRQIADGVTDGVGEVLRDLVRDVHQELAELDQRIATYNRRIRHLFRTNEECQRIGKIEGIGPITATALVAAMGDRSCFKNGRQFAAWLGLVPKQRSSGGKSRLFGINKRGDRYLRTLISMVRRPFLAKPMARRIPEVNGSAGCGSGGIRTSSLSLSPTRMPGSCGRSLHEASPIARLRLCRRTEASSETTRTRRTFPRILQQPGRRW
jgi:hypothetical protein